MYPSILNEISSEYSLEGQMLKLKFQYFGHLMNWLIGKDPDAGKDWRQVEKGMTEDEMVGWHHQLDGHEFEQAPGVGDGQGSLACCSPRGCKESDTTELNQYIHQLIDIWVASTFWQLWWILLLFDSIFWSTKLFNFDDVQFIFFFYFLCFGVLFKNALLNPRPWRLTLRFSSKSRIVVVWYLIFSTSLS